MAAKKDTQKMRISIKAFDHRLLDDAVAKIV
jgi:ribosomal protein S10